MANQKLTDKLARELPGDKIYYDSEVAGFGLRVTEAGARAFVLNYRAGRRERRMTIGSFPAWSVRQARERAAELRRQIDAGGDPMGERHADRAAATINDLADRFEAEHLGKRRPSTQADYRAILRLHIRPALGKMKVADVADADIERLHRKLSATAPYQANRTVAVLSVMLALAVKAKIRADNPAKGIERAPEEKRERFLSPAEIARLGEALAALPERASADAIRLLLLTGARKQEILAARWAEFDLDAGVWTKPSARTKQARMHRVPLSAPARALLADMRAAADPEDARRRRDGLEPVPFVFPRADGGPLHDVRRSWIRACARAGLAVQVEKTDAAGKPARNSKGEPVLIWQATARIHDLRHTYASILVGSGLSLPIIGALLGHSRPETTARYAHLADDPLRAATERAGAVIGGAAGADVVPLRRA